MIYVQISTFPFIMLILKLTLLSLNQNRGLDQVFQHTAYPLIYLGRDLSSESLFARVLGFETFKNIISNVLLLKS